MDYAAIKENAERDWKWLENLPQPLIQVGTGTCGKASGADKTMESVRNFSNVDFSKLCC